MWILTSCIVFVSVGLSLQAECDVTNNQGFCGAQCIEGYAESQTDTCAEGVCCYVDSCPFDQGAFCGPSCDVVAGYVDSGDPCVDGVCCIPEDCPNGVCIPAEKQPLLGPDFSEDEAGTCAPGEICLVFEVCDGLCVPEDKAPLIPGYTEDPAGICIQGDVCIIPVVPTTAGPEETTEAAIDTTAAAEETTAAAEETTLGAEETTLGAEETTLGAEETTLGAEETTLGAEETTLGAEETTAAEEITTAAEEITTTPAVTTPDTQCEGGTIDGLCLPQSLVPAVPACATLEPTATDCKPGESCCVG